ncbi:MAG: hypothetical protein BRC29_02370 [Nanohaloarchaea archaeon SW_7_43_1]|nr:MAG: hypothetical protein BRC29_02370 [Nanohaloarchaea archaeon SW_7_43_1]
MNDLKIHHVFRLYTLILLQEGEKTGYEIMDRIEENIGEKPSTSFIYPFLSDLEKRSLVSVEQGGRNKKIYSLTDDGNEFASEKLNSFGEILEASIQNQVEDCEKCGCEIYSGGYDTDGETYCCKHCASA